MKGGVTMVTTRYYCRDDLTVEDYKDIERFPPNPEDVVFANELKKLLDDRICCVPVVHVEGPNGTTVGLGDAFVGEFLPALLS
jgi:ADP-dependent phosphofructokinase/glucokinase